MKRSLFAAAAVLLAIPASASGASGDWNVWCNASAVNRVYAAGDSLWCATRGGIMVMNLADSSFTSHLDDLGFRSTDVTGIAIDRRGSVWASFMTTGVARIDRFAPDAIVKLYGSAIEGLLSDSVTCVAAAGDEVYYGSSAGVAKFFDNVHSYETVLTDSLEGVRVNDLLVRGDTLYVACDRGVARFNRATFAYVLYPVGKAVSLCVHEGAVHAATAGGVRRFDGTSWTSLGLPGGFVPLAAAAGSGALYAVTEGRAFVRAGSSWTEITANMKTMLSQRYKIFSNYNVPRTIAVDARGTLWLGGFEPQLDRGAYVSFYNGASWINKAPVELTQNGVIALSLAPNGEIWTSTKHFGVGLLRGDGSWAQYTKLRTTGDPAGFSYFSFMYAFLLDSQGSLWCNVQGNDLDRVVVNDPATPADDVWSHYALNAGTITSNRYVRIKEDPAGNRWFLSDDVVAGMSGVDILSADGTSWLAVDPSIEPRMAGGSVFDVAFGPNGTVYLALRNYGLQMWVTGGYDWTSMSSLAGDAWATLIDPDDLASKTVYCCERGADGTAWLGTASGLVRYRAGVVDSFTIKTEPGRRGLVGAQVYDLEFDKRGSLWVATDQGLNRIDPDGVIAAYTTYDAWQGNLYPSSVISPLPSPVCQALAYDAAADLLWIGTAGGLARLDVSPPEQVVVPLSRMILYPNPVHLSRGDAALRVGRISSPVSIRVFTLEGELVHEIDGVAEGGVAWDLLTLNGFKATSGVYVVRVSSRSPDGRRETSVETRKIAVIR